MSYADEDILRAQLNLFKRQSVLTNIQDNDPKNLAQYINQIENSKFLIKSKNDFELLIILLIEGVNIDIKKTKNIDFKYQDPSLELIYNSIYYNRSRNLYTNFEFSGSSFILKSFIDFYKSINLYNDQNIIFSTLNEIILNYPGSLLEQTAFIKILSMCLKDKKFSDFEFYYDQFHFRYSHSLLFSKFNYKILSSASRFSDKECVNFLDKIYNMGHPNSIKTDDFLQIVRDYIIRGNYNCAKIILVHIDLFNLLKADLDKYTFYNSIIDSVINKTKLSIPNYEELDDRDLKLYKTLLLINNKIQ